MVQKRRLELLREQSLQFQEEQRRVVHLKLQVSLLLEGEEVLLSLSLLGQESVHCGIPEPFENGREHLELGE